MQIMAKDIHQIFRCPQTALLLPEFLTQIYFAEPNQTVLVQSSQRLDSLTRLVEYCYCNRLIRPITGVEAQSLVLLCAELGLSATGEVFN